MSKKNEIENLKKMMAEMALKIQELEAKPAKKVVKKTVKKIKQDNNLTFDLFDVEHDEMIEKKMKEIKAKEAKEEAKAEANKANKDAEAKKSRQQAITKKIMATKKAKAEAKLKRKEMNIIKKEEIKIKLSQYYNTKVIFFKYFPKDDEPEGKKVKYVKDAEGRKIFQLGAPHNFNVNNPKIIDFENRRIYREFKKQEEEIITKSKFGTIIMKKDTSEFKQLTNLLKEDKENFNSIEQLISHNYINMIQVCKIRILRINQDMKDLTEIELREFEGGNINHQYIKYEINENATTFGDLFKFELAKGIQLSNVKNACFLNAIINTFKSSFDKQNENKRKKFVLNFQNLLELLNYSKKTDFGVCINTAVERFFKPNNLGLLVFSPYGILFKYQPETRNHHITPSNLFMCVMNNHCYPINCDIKHIEKIEWINNKTFRDVKIKVNSKFHFQSKKIKEDEIIINELNELKNDIIKIEEKQQEKKEKKEKKEKDIIIDRDYIIDEKLNDVLISMMHDNITPYTPTVYLKNGKLNKINFNIGKLKCSIKDKNNSIEEITHIEISDYKKYKNIDTKFYNGLICLENMSTYSDQYLKIVETVFRSPMKNKFFDVDTSNKHIIGLDSRKAYTSDFMDIKKYPVFNIFDLYNAYNNEKIEDYNEYIIECLEETVESLLIFPDRMTAIFGIVLKEVKNINYKILYVRIPSNLHESNSRDLVDMVYQSELKENEKKQIINLNLGKLEKKNNNVSNSKVFKNIDEAYYYQNIYDEKYKARITIIEPTDEELYKNDNEIHEKAVYILTFSAEKQLNEGFQSIKDLVYDIRRLKNLKTYLKLKDNKIVCYGVITDSMLIDNKDFEKAKQLFNFNNEIGNFKVEINKVVPFEKLMRNYNLIEVDILKKNIIVLKNERDKEEILNINNNMNVFYKGLFPGVGKTTSCSVFGGKKLFNSPHHKLCQELRINYTDCDAITFYRLLNISITEDTKSKNKAYNISKIKCIIFDEVLLYSVSKLMMIKKFVVEHPEIRFLFSGDCDQRKPFKFGCNNVDLKHYQMTCMSVICNNEILLSIPKRLTEQADIDKMENLKIDIFDVKLNVISTLKKYGFKIINKMDDLTTEKNICYFNMRTNKIINHVLKNVVKVPDNAILIDDLKYWLGLELTYRSDNICFNKEKIKIFKNYTYQIKNIDDEITLFDIVDKIDFCITREQLRFFKHPYASTCDSVQGLPIKDKYTIFDCNITYTDREYVWTALTRTTKFEDITIFEHSEKEVNNLTDAKIRQYFKLKIINYKKQDEKASRIITDDYIDVEWINNEFVKNKICGYDECQNNLTVEIDEYNNIVSNISVDRINNKISHLKNNCCLMCVHCNCAKH